MRYVVIGLSLAVACLIVGPAQAQVHVNIGINLPGPPEWAVIPGLPVYYAPAVAANVFQYNGSVTCLPRADGMSGPATTAPGSPWRQRMFPHPSCASRWLTITNLPDIGGNGIPKSGLAGSTNMGVNGTSTGRAGAVGEDTTTSRTEQRSTH